MTGKKQEPITLLEKDVIWNGIEKASFSYILLAASKQDKSEIERVLNDLFWR